jgi:hypothetical protein
LGFVQVAAGQPFSNKEHAHPPETGVLLAAQPPANAAGGLFQELVNFAQGSELRERRDVFDFFSREERTLRVRLISPALRLFMMTKN